MEFQIKYRREDDLADHTLEQTELLALPLGPCSVPGLFEIALFLVPPDVNWIFYVSHLANLEAHSCEFHIQLTISSFPYPTFCVFYYLQT